MSQLKPLTKEWARAFLPAVDALIAHYKKETFLDECPFCLIVDEMGNDGCSSDEPNSICPWAVFEKRYCYRWLHHGKKYDVVDLRHDRPDWWCARSLKRLARWRRRLVKIIEGKQ